MLTEKADRSTPPRSGRIAVRTLGVTVAIQCADRGVLKLFAAHYGAMHAAGGAAALAYTIARRNGAWLVARDGTAPVPASDPGELLLHVDQDVIVQLQLLRPDLYFVHAGVLEIGGRSVMLVAPSGGGKSTTTWALVHHGFRYLSDELGPVELSSLSVHPYPRALLLKSAPPPSYPVPRSTLRTSRGFHLPSNALASGIREAPARLGAIFFLSRARRNVGPPPKRLSGAEAAARLYVNVLNPLAHPDDGLGAATHIARTIACFELLIGEPGAVVGSIEGTLDGLRRC
jgi:hypothetical protein